MSTHRIALRSKGLTANTDFVLERVNDDGSVERVYDFLVTAIKFEAAAGDDGLTKVTATMYVDEVDIELAVGEDGVAAIHNAVSMAKSAEVPRK